MKLTIARLKEVADYNPDTGIFIRKIRTSMNTKVGDKLGSLNNNGYMYAMIDYETFSIHHLSWFYVYGVMPMHCIDHINGIKTDNRISNLRDIPFINNMQNERKARVNSTSGYLGVRWRKDRSKWVATLRVNGKAKRLGSFDNKEDAYQCYLEAKRLYHPGFTL
jgi:hypothetical protein